MMEVIKTNKLSRIYDVYEPYSEESNIFKKVFARKHSKVEALTSIDMSINKGDIKGYIGINGAGKSTTIKLLSGILKPTSGEVEVMGMDPFKFRKKVASKIGVIFGQRSQLWWDLPVIKTYELLKSVYQISDDIYSKNISMFTELLEMEKIIDTPVKSLSLGQRMRAEFAASFLHNPEIVFLDEPTIGLDVVAKEKIRYFLKEINLRDGVTVLISSHDLMDIEELCSSVILINKGEKIYDGQLDFFLKQYETKRYITLECSTSNITVENFENLEFISKENNKLVFAFTNDKHNIMSVVNLLFSKYPVVDFHIKDPSLESIIKKMHEEGGVR
jgi:ABC-2 type transport system ATP-binding protein